MFLFAHDISSKVFKRIKKHFSKTGVEPQVHGNTRAGSVNQSLGLKNKGNKRSSPMCSYCHDKGHRNQLRAGKPDCPKRLKETKSS